MRKAILKLNGSIIDVTLSILNDGSRIWVEHGTNRHYRPEELKFLVNAENCTFLRGTESCQIGKEQVSADFCYYPPCKIIYGLCDECPYHSSSVLSRFSDKDLREELKRRVAERKAANVVLRCRDCKHCGEGCCKQSSRYKTSVCFLKPKPQAGPDRYYATLYSRKACENFEKK